MPSIGEHEDDGQPKGSGLNSQPQEFRLDAGSSGSSKGRRADIARKRAELASIREEKVQAELEA